MHDIICLYFFLWKFQLWHAQSYISKRNKSSSFMYITDRCRLWKGRGSVKEPKWTTCLFCLLISMIQKVSILVQCKQILHAGYNSSIFGSFVDFYSSYDSCSSQNIFWILIPIIKYCEITAINNKIMSPTTVVGFVWIAIVVLLTAKLLTLLINSD